MPYPRTWYSHGTPLIYVTPNAKLPVAVRSPALDPATRLDCARVREPQGDGGGGDACRDGGGIMWEGRRLRRDRWLRSPMHTRGSHAPCLADARGRDQRTAPPGPIRNPRGGSRLSRMLFSAGLEAALQKIP
jgi:hypothetical protein